MRVLLFILVLGSLTGCDWLTRKVESGIYTDMSKEDDKDG